MALTPIERAIRQQTDRRARWDAAKREQGLIRTTIMVHRDVLQEVRDFIKAANESAMANRSDG